MKNVPEKGPSVNFTCYKNENPYVYEDLEKILVLKRIVTNVAIS